MWWKKLILPTKKHVGVRRAIFWWDNVLVLGVGAVWITALVLWAVYGNHSVTWTLLCGFVLPFLAFNCIMGFVIYVQHTHPEVAWFDKREEWQKRLGFITTTVNVVVPKRMGEILHDILEHGAHHVNTGVPLYRLRAAQTALKNAVPQLARVYVLSWKRYWATVRTCKLYDYANHQWMDFKGGRRHLSGRPLLSPRTDGARAVSLWRPIFPRQLDDHLAQPGVRGIGFVPLVPQQHFLGVRHLEGQRQDADRQGFRVQLRDPLGQRRGQVDPGNTSGSCSRLGSVR